ncbi:hypothetical protein K504DRAFT_464455 [Pleomassaria siparia CBS 279.74]|uniref:Uncharacterized protein n=1 Tax=Pleomassaria siparia CBS 279.74 TaxID=1314801 RepID=A0A6G1KIQ4_9PLEO|nr:hypothetical protein K504DRAFT_464455 [Pleomassaria siparia CBS 279.74]
MDSVSRSRSFKFLDDLACSPQTSYSQVSTEVAVPLLNGGLTFGDCSQGRRDDRGRVSFVHQMGIIHTVCTYMKNSRSTPGGRDSGDDGQRRLILALSRKGTTNEYVFLFRPRGNSPFIDPHSRNILQMPTEVLCLNKPMFQQNFESRSDVLSCLHTRAEYT